MKKIFKTLGFFGFIVWCIMSCVSFGIFMWCFIPHVIRNILGGIKRIYFKAYSFYLIKMGNKFHSVKDFDIDKYAKSWEDPLD